MVLLFTNTRDTAFEADADAAFFDVQGVICLPLSIGIARVIDVLCSREDKRHLFIGNMGLIPVKADELMVIAASQAIGLKSYTSAPL